MKNNIEKKEFDCVEMKRHSAELIFKKISKMTRAQELKYWKEKELELDRLINTSKNKLKRKSA